MPNSPQPLLPDFSQLEIVMSSCSIPAAADQGGGTPITAIHSDIIQSHILNRLDGSTLASTSCASLQFLSLCNQDRLWRDICNANWPSTTHPRVREAVGNFPSAHRSFYSDVFPSVNHRSLCHQENKTRLLETSELISAVDIYYDDKLIHSKVLETETLSGWFVSSPFRLELLDPKETVSIPLKFETGEVTCTALAEEHLRVSWILIDRARKRAINVASQRPVEARMHWLNEDIQLRYATVVTDGGGELVQCAVILTYGGKEGELRVKEVSMQVEDMEGKILSGMDSLGILQGAMEGQRMKIESKMEKDIYEMFWRMKVQCRERKQTREKSLDTLCIATAVSLFFAIWILFLFT